MNVKFLYLCRSLLKFSAISLIALLASGCVSGTPRADYNELYLPVHIENCLVLIETVGPSADSPKWILEYATGFLMVDTLGRVYLITCRHVFNGKESVRVTFNTTRGDSLRSYKATVQLKASGHKLWVGHPDSLVDLSAVRTQTLFTNAIDIDRLKMLADVRLGDKVLFPGFPLLELTKGDISYPIVRRGLVAHKTTYDVQAPDGVTGIPSKHLLLDGTVLHGNSGSPVFSYPKAGTNRMSIVGMIRSRMSSRDADVDIRLGICIPADRIKELVENYDSLLSLSIR